jgi:AcrR family transcriptional regulator
VVGGRGRRTTGRPRVARTGTARASARASGDPASGSTRRDELLERVADHLLEHGVASFSLRSAADLVGASARMLVHHFGSKERLVSAAIAVVRTRRVEALGRDGVTPMTSFDAVFRERWDTLASAEFRRYFVLNLELMALALREPRRYREFLGATTEEWRSGFVLVLRNLGFTDADADATSTLYIDALRGLLLDLAVTRDRDRVEAAVEMLAEKLKADLARHMPSTGT